MYFNDAHYSLFYHFTEFCYHSRFAHAFFPYVNEIKEKIRKFIKIQMLPQFKWKSK